MKKLLFIIFLLPTLIFSQELNATVTINTEQLPISSRDVLKNFAMSVQDYLNNNRFSGNNWEWPKIKCDFNIFFVGGNTTQFRAQVIVTSQRPVENLATSSLILNIKDENWLFPYEENQAMYFGQADFDPLVSFLDYYANVILGFDADSYNLDGGTQFFNNALEITVRGSNSEYSEGWKVQGSKFNRRGLVEDVLSGLFSQFRADFFDYHYNGIDIFSTDPKTAQANFVKLINNLDSKKDQIDSRSVLMRVFFNAKAGEITEYLKNYPDKNIFKKLIQVDRPNTSKYEKALE